MTRKDFEILIDARPDIIWFCLWDLYHYRIWTGTFCEGSYAVTDNWEEGTRVHFLTPEGKGMYSDISLHLPEQAMIFTHQGIIENFREIPGATSWTGAREQYSLKDSDNQIRLHVQLDLDENHLAYFEQVFPPALQRIKELAENPVITISEEINKSPQLVWKWFTQPEHIIHWNAASDDWATVAAQVDLQEGGRFCYRMEALDQSAGFEFCGTFTRIVPNVAIHYKIDDGRTVEILFTETPNGTCITERFQPENINDPFEQRDGWQQILTRFRNYATSML